MNPRYHLNEAENKESWRDREKVPFAPAPLPAPDRGYHPQIPELPGLPSHGLARPFDIKRKRPVLPGYRF